MSSGSRKEIVSATADSDRPDNINNEKMPAASLTKTMANSSPFLIEERDAEVLAQSEGFSILRDHLADHYSSEYVSTLSFRHHCSI